MNNYNPSHEVLDVVYFLFGGREGVELKVDVMESKVLEWGRLTNADDPVVDWPVFESVVVDTLRRQKK